MRGCTIQVKAILMHGSRSGRPSGIILERGIKKGDNREVMLEVPEAARCEKSMMKSGRKKRR